MEAGCEYLELARRGDIVFVRVCACVCLFGAGGWVPRVTFVETAAFCDVCVAGIHKVALHPLVMLSVVDHYTRVAKVPRVGAATLHHDLI